MFRVKRKAKYWFIRVAKKIIDLLPVDNNKIIYDNFGGNGFGGNPRYINEYLQSHSKYKSVWLTRGDQEFPDYVKVVRINSLQAYYEASTAKMRITNIRNSKFPKKKKSQLHLQTWHSSYGFKMCEKAIEDRLHPNYVNAAKYDGAITDAIVVDSELQKSGFQKNFWLNENVEFLCFGLPRTDLLINYSNSNDVRKLIFERFNIPEQNILVLYAPTFRDDRSIVGYIDDFDRIKWALHSKFGKQVTIGIRFHPNAKKEFSDLDYKNIVNFTNEGNMQELEIASDILITDYSSVMFDFAILKKPVFVCATDFEIYSKTRIKVKEYMEMPFPLSFSLNDLIDDIDHFDLQAYNDKIQCYLKEHPFYSDGRSAERIGNWIIEKMG